MQYLLDTNILMNVPEILEKDTDDVYHVSDLTITELDYKKESKNEETAYKARRASHYLMKYYDKITFIPQAKEKFDRIDDALLLLTNDYHLTLLTSDLNVCLKAKIMGIAYEFYDRDTSNYIGIQYYKIKLDENCYNEELDLMLEKGIAPAAVQLCINEFLIVTDINDNVLSIFQYRNNKLNIVKIESIKNKYVNTVTPRNTEQICLVSALKNKNTNIICAKGGFGTGKTFLTLNYALQELEKGNISKIVFVPNNAYVHDAREHGFEPGSALEKEMAFLGTIIDIMGEYEVSQSIQYGRIEVVPLATMRGRNFDNSIILVNEAQNLSEDHIRLLIGRVGQNSKIIFDGDEKQTDSAIFKNKSGLKLLSRLKDSEQFAPIFGMVKLHKVERSLTAQAADYLDTL